MDEVVDLEEIGQTGLADVKTHKQHTLTKQGKRHGQVGSHESLALARGGRGEHDDLLVFLQHELYIGTHGAEDLLHLVVLVLVHHDLTLGLGRLRRHGDIGNDGQRGKLGHIFVSFDLVAEELKQEENK